MPCYLKDGTPLVINGDLSLCLHVSQILPSLYMSVFLYEPHMPKILIFASVDK